MILMWDETISDSDETTIFYAISWFLTESSRSSFNYLSFFTKLKVMNVLIDRVRINQITNSKKFFFWFVSYINYRQKVLSEQLVISK
jgi:hypothetical protein